MSEIVNETNEVVVAESIVEEVVEPTDYLEPIKDVAEKIGVTMPDLVGVGDLTVDKVEKPQVNEVPAKEVNKKDIPLPTVGSKFMLNSHEYKVVYINAGQHRFSCEPCKGVY